MNKVNYSEIRQLYKDLDASRYWAYPIDWTQVFTPIEYQAWCDIRDYELEMWPQYPIGKYFADFANIKKKIAIECDGKEWHDPAKDAIRDAAMIADGWTIYRMTGAECCRVVDEGNYSDKGEYLHQFYKTCSGVIKAIYNFHFRPIINDENEEWLALRALKSHRSTGEVKRIKVLEHLVPTKKREFT